MTERIKSTKKRILIIDDNRQIHLDIKKILLVSEDEDNNLDNLKESILGIPGKRKEKRYIIDCALQGKEGLRMVKESLRKNEPYSVAFVDMRMPPGCDGVETISRIWKICPELQIIICTAYSDYSWTEIIKRLGYSDKLLVLKKPFDNIEAQQLVCALSRKWELSKIANLKMSELDTIVKERTRELNKTKSQIESILNTAPVHIAFVDLSGKYAGWNKTSEEIFGYKEEESTGKLRPERFFRKKEEAGAAFDKVKKEGIFDGEVILVRRNGVEFPAHLLVSRTIDSSNKHIGFTWLAIDITKKKQAEEKLRKSENRYRLLEEEIIDLHKKQAGERKIIGKCDPMKKVFTLIEKVAETDASVLIYGETGTGKESIAHAVHNCSFRKEKPFGIVDCASIPSELLEAELFGYEKGAFTGAYAQKKGQFETAKGGTLFLDEISDLTLALQSKLLRVLQEKDIRRVGGTERIKVDIRLITSTNIDLEALVKAGEFRNDLYYRLSVFPIKLPPLRERGDDIMLLAQYFLSQFGRNRAKKGFTGSAEEVLKAYHWPGNIRELQHRIERAVIMSDSEYLSQEDLELGKKEIVFNIGKLEKLIKGKSEINLKEMVENIERKIIEEIFDRCNRNQRKTARLLNIGLSGLQYKLKKYKMI